MHRAVAQRHEDGAPTEERINAPKPLVALGIIPFVVLLRRLLRRLVLPPQDGPVGLRLGYRPAQWTRSRQSSHVPLV